MDTSWIKTNVYLLQNNQMKIFILLAAIVLSSCAHKSDYRKINNKSWSQLFSALQFSGEGKLSLELGSGSAQNFSFESLLESDQLLIEVSKSIYGSELLTLSLSSERFDGELMDRVERKLPPRDLKSLKSVSQFFARFLKAHISASCKDLDCYLERLGPSWHIVRTPYGVRVSHQTSSYLFEILAEGLNHNKLKNLSISLKEKGRTLSLVFSFSEKS